MRKLTYTVALMIALMTSAQAQEFKPYIGVDLQHTKYQYNKNYDIGGGLALDINTLINDGLNGVSLHVGNRFNRYFGAELGGFYNREKNKSIAAGTLIGPGTVALTDLTTAVRSYGLTLDGLGYLPLNETFDFIGTAGLTWTRADIKLGDLSNDHSTEWGFRAGAGAQANLTPAISMRALARYQTADFDETAEHAWTYSLGLNYGF